MRRSTVTIIAAFVLSLAFTDAAHAQAQSATKALRDQRAQVAAPETAPSSAQVSGAWAQALRDAHADAVLAEPTPGASVSGSSTGGLGGVFIGFVAILLTAAGAAAGWFAGRQREFDTIARALDELDGLSNFEAPAQQPPPTIEFPEFPAFPEPPVSDVAVRARHVIEGHGDLMVVEVDGEILVVFVDDHKDNATLVSRLSAEPDEGWQLEVVAERVIAAMRAGAPGAAAVAAAATFPRAVAPEPSMRPPGQDEDLDVLLDDLLDKVRDLKPLTKSEEAP